MWEFIKVICTFIFECIKAFIDLLGDATNFLRDEAKSINECNTENERDRKVEELHKLREQLDFENKEKL